MPAPTNVPLPLRMSQLPTDPRGYVIPFFVAIVDGKPDFRVVDGAKRQQCIDRKLCWLCGQRMGAFGAFVIGPMCAINRISSEPPSHRECATYAAQVCPFLTKPFAERREANLPEGAVEPEGKMLRRNPGVCLIWVSKTWRRWQGLWNVGQPTECFWVAEGRAATRAEIEASIESGLPLLREGAEAQGPQALKMLDDAHRAALEILPAA